MKNAVEPRLALSLVHPSSGCVTESEVQLMMGEDYIQNNDYCILPIMNAFIDNDKLDT